MTQEKDLFINQYLENPEHFADIYNGTVFRGKQIIKPEDLSPAESNQSILLPDKSGRKKQLDATAMWSRKLIWELSLIFLHAKIKLT